MKQAAAKKPKKPKIEIYTDGAARGNPGPGGYGIVLRYYDPLTAQKTDKELSAGYRLTTNNRMEMLALTVALEALKLPCSCEVYSDSQYVIDAFCKGWLDSWQRKAWKTAAKKPVKNRDLWERLLRAAAPHDLNFHWVRGHAGHLENERCDELATTAADQPQMNLLIDEGYEQLEPSLK